MNDALVQHLSQIGGGLIAIAIGTADLWHFHALPLEVAVASIGIGYLALGLKSLGIPTPK